MQTPGILGAASAGAGRGGRPHQLLRGPLRTPTCLRFHFPLIFSVDAEQENTFWRGSPVSDSGQLCLRGTALPLRPHLRSGFSRAVSRLRGARWAAGRRP